MKKILLTVTGVIMMCLTTSCTFSENITIAENGTGKMSLDVDGSSLMAMAGEELAASGKQEKIDSTFTFRDVFASKKDSIAKLPKEERDRLMRLEKFTVKMLMDSDAGQMKMNIFTDFNKANELPDLMKTFGDVTAMNKKPGQPDLGMLQNNAEVSYAYDGKKFTRNVKLLDKPKTDSGEDMEMYQAMLGSSTYELKYTFPKKVKKVSSKSAVISADGKTVTVSYALSDYFENPKTMALEVEF